MSRSTVSGVRRAGIVVLLAATVTGAAGGGGLPDGFAITEVVGGFQRPVDLAFAEDGRMFVAEQEGFVWVVEDGVRLPDPFIDLTDEIQGEWDRGLLGIALDPGFLDNRRVFLLYTVDPIFGEPDESPFDGTLGRLTSYVGTVESGGNVADPASRCVLIGETVPEGIPVCEPSHTIGTVVFGTDGSLFVGAGDGAHFDTVDAGGLDPECFKDGMFGKDEDIGAFRAQYLGSLAGKILRIDPDTGRGLDTNPHWTGDGADKRSKVWVNGLRNPFRFALRPGTPGPGTLYIGDVGWSAYEEISVAGGGENFGWPCREGFQAAPGYPSRHPDHSGCDSIETKENPGPLTDPIIAWHHSNPSRSDPPGFTGRCAVGGVFYDGRCYPELYRGAYFLMDHRNEWIRVIEVNDDDEFVAMHEFATGVDGPVDLEPHPMTRDLHVVNIFEGRIQRISYVEKSCDCPADLDGDGLVGFGDILAILAAWGPYEPCPPAIPEDIDQDCDVGFSDLLIVLAAWGPCG